MVFLCYPILIFIHSFLVTDWILISLHSSHRQPQGPGRPKGPPMSPVRSPFCHSLSVVAVHNVSFYDHSHPQSRCPQRLMLELKHTLVDPQQHPATSLPPPPTSQSTCASGWACPTWRAAGRTGPWSKTSSPSVWTASTAGTAAKPFPPKTAK